MSHLHMFFGNTSVDAFSTSAKLQTSGTSTCGGGTLNRTGYWVPAMINKTTGQPVRATSNNVYYKSGYYGIVPGLIHPVPKGLVMISGTASNTLPGVNPVRYSCEGSTTGQWQSTIPSCGPTDGLIMEVTFPQCWDGVNLDSANHKSHMAFPVNNACPADHPVAIPVVSYNVHYPSVGAATNTTYALSSDNYDTSQGGAGNSGHGDYMYGWDDTTMATFIANCTSKSVDCHDYLLGNGQMLY